MKNNLALMSFIHAVLASAYVAGVAYLMQNGERFFGQMDNLIGPMSFLLLFVLSAAIMVVLVVGKPHMLYLDGKKKEAVYMLLSTIGWIALITLLTLLVQIIK